jgi:hypothetical protein
MAEDRTLKGIYGEHGAVYENGTNAVAGEFCAITVIAEATFSALTWSEQSGDNLTSVAIPAGTTIYGQITAFTLSGGSVLAYKAGK